jgi:ribonuclease BN (tRNA processing enzyme)
MTAAGTHGLALTVIGCAPAYTRRPWPSSCYLVEAAGTRVVLDLGQGSFSALGARVAPETLDAVVISHLHPDHHIDLVPLRHYLRYGCGPTAHEVALHAPADLRRRYDELTGEPGFLDGLPGGGLTPGQLAIGDLRITTAPVLHRGPSFGFRVVSADAPNGPGLVYSGDCGRPEDVLALVRPADTLLCEAAFGAGPIIDGPEHLNAEAAARIAAEGRVATLVLTHVLDEGRSGTAATARKRFGGRVLMARPGLRLVVA